MKATLRRRLRRLAVGLLAADLVYVVAFEWAARSGRLERWLGRRPERFALSFAAAHSPLPFWVLVRGLDVQGQTRIAQWRVEAERAGGWIAPWALLDRRLLFLTISGDGVTVAARARVRDPAVAAERLPRLPAVPAFALDDPLEIAPPPPGRRWSFEFPRLEARSIADVWLETWRIAGARRASGGFAIRRAETAEILPSRLELADGAALRLDGRAVATGLSGGLDLELAPYRYRDVRGLAALEPLTVRLRLAGSLDEGALLAGFLHRVAWLEFDRSPTAFQADLALAGGVVAPGSRLATVASERRLRFFGFEAVGGAALEFEVKKEGDAALAELAIRFGDYAVGRVGETPQVHGSGLAVDASARDLRPGPLGDDGRVAIDLGRATLERLEALAPLVPEAADLTLLGGVAELGGRLEGDLGNDSGTGRAAVRLRELRARYGDLELQGDVDLELALASDALRARSFRLDGSRVDLYGFRTVATTPEPAPAETPTEGWWARFELGQSQLDLQTPVTADGAFDVALRDTRPLVALYAERRELPEWAERLLEIEEVRASGRFRYQRPELAIDDLETRSEHAALTARLELGRGQRRGALLLEWRALAAAVALEGGKRDWKLVGAREWYRQSRDTAVGRGSQPVSRMGLTIGRGDSPHPPAPQPHGRWARKGQGRG